MKRPKKLDPHKAPLEELIAALEETLAGFAFNLHTFGRGNPVMFNWRHNDQLLRKWEMSKLMLCAGTYRTLRDAFAAVLARVNAYLDETEKKEKSKR